MGYAFCLGTCINCAKSISFNPRRVPSIKVDGVKEPLCAECCAKWNEIHRVSKGLEPIPPHKDAYTYCREEDL